VAGSISTSGGNFQFIDAGTPDSTAVRLFSAYGALYLQNGSGNAIYFRNKTAGINMAILDGGNVGVATTAPASLFDVFGSASFGVPTFGGNGLGTDGKFQILTGGASPIADRLVFGTDNSGWKMAISKNSAGTITDLMTVQDNGNVGIGTTNPGATYANTKLEVNGYIQTDAGIYFPGNATPQTVPYTGVACGGDYAESVDVTGSRTNYEPGDVLVLDAENPGKVLKSAEAYSTSVSGIYSTKPGMVGRRQTTDAKTSTSEVPMAMVGIVPAKVSAENGPIKVGDLLVTSSTLGYAMKGTDRSQMLGAVIGKALGSLDSGTGVIEVLVTLQ
jgi:hypothetical protein